MISPDEMKLVYTVDTFANEHEIRQTLRVNGEFLSAQIFQLKEQGLCDALIKLGWTPPPEKPRD